MTSVARLAMAALVACLSAPLAMPALAAPADVALLLQYAGNWRGKGPMTGADTGTVACRLALKPSGEKIRFSGRCTLPGAGGSGFSGTLSYNAAANRFEATSSNGTVIGRKRGGGIVFAMEDDTRQGKVTSTMSLTGGTIKVEFQIIDAKTDRVTQARIPFAKS